MVLTLPLLLGWTARPLALTLLHVPLFVVCAMPVALTLYGLQTLMAALAFLRPDLPWLPVSMALLLGITVVARVTGRLLRSDEALLRREGPQVRLAMLWVAFALACATALRALPLELPLCWAAVHTIVGLALPRREVRASAKHVAASIGLLGASCVVALLLGEAGARVLFGAPKPPAVMLHPERMRTLRPGTEGVHMLRLGEGMNLGIPFVISADGLRGKPLSPKKPGVIRILALGDSFTFGIGVHDEETYPRQLELLLNEGAGEERFEVVNAGLGGTGPFQQLHLFLEIAAKVNPDLVVHQLLPSNDIGDDLTFAGMHMEASDPNYVQFRHFMLHGPHRLIGLQEELCARSSLFAALWVRSGANWQTLDLGRHFRGLAPMAYPQPEPTMARPPTIETMLRKWYPALVQGWALNKKHVRLLRDTCSGAGIDYFAFAAPDMEAVSDGVWAYMPVAHPQLEGQMHLYDPEKNARISRKFFRESGIPYADMFREFRKHPRPDRLYYITDGHWNLHGCRYAAQVVARALAAQWPEVFPSPPPADPVDHAENPSGPPVEDTIASQ
jgi:hypothetical protein